MPLANFSRESKASATLKKEIMKKGVNRYKTFELFRAVHSVHKMSVRVKKGNLDQLNRS